MSFMSINTSLQVSWEGLGPDRLQATGILQCPVCSVPLMVKKIVGKKWFPVSYWSLYPLKRINRDAVWRSVLHVDQFNFIG
jgi:hypothetical protein